MVRDSLLLVCCLSLVTPAAADSLFERLDANDDGYVVRPEIPAEHARLFDRLLRRADADADERLSREEFAEGMTPSTPPKPLQEAGGYSRPQSDALKLLLLRLDTNRDAYLTRGEAPRELRDAFDQLAKAADQDKDGQIAFRELVQSAGPTTRAAGQIARRQQWDVAKELEQIEKKQGESSGRFDRQPDPRAALVNPQRTASIFKQLDADDDGRLKLDELPDQAREQLGRLFRRADRDRSGDLTQREFTTAAGRAGRLIRLLERSRSPASDKAAKQ